MTSKIDIFGQILTHFFVRVIFDHLGIKKVVFWTSKLFSSCFWNAKALFSALKGLLLDVFSPRKNEKSRRYLRFFVKCWPSKRFILTISGSKS